MEICKFHISQHHSKPPVDTMRNNKTPSLSYFLFCFVFSIYFTFTIQVLCKASDVYYLIQCLQLWENSCFHSIDVKIEIQWLDWKVKSKSVAELGLLCLADPPLRIAALPPGQKHYGVGVSGLSSLWPPVNTLHPLSSSSGSYSLMQGVEEGNEKVAEGWGLKTDARQGFGVLRPLWPLENGYFR